MARLDPWGGVIPEDVVAHGTAYVPPRAVMAATSRCRARMRWGWCQPRLLRAVCGSTLCVCCRLDVLYIVLYSLYANL